VNAVRDQVLLFYREPERDRFVPGDRYLRRAVRPLIRTLRGGQTVSGFGVWFQSLVKALRSQGVPVIVNDRRLALRHPDHPVGLVGAPEVLQGWDLPNPAVLGPGMFDHPGASPGLMKDPRFRRYLVTCGWMGELFRPAYGEACVPWYGAIDAAEWPDTRGAVKDIDVLVYDKIRWDREPTEQQLLRPAIAWLRQHGLSHRVIRYGHYQHREYRELLGRARSLLYLCESETQGMAYQEALASNVPVLAWDNGFWLDPRRAQWQAAPVPASSVPYFSDECGRRFRGAEDFAAVAQGFFADLGGFEPRRYVLRELSPAGSARLYLEHYRSLLPVKSPRAPRVHIGKLGIDPLTFTEAIEAIDSLVVAKNGGSVFTPNVDHVVNAQAIPELSAAYGDASLSLVDGTPLLWSAKLLGRPLPQKVSGSDLLEPLIARAALRGWRVFLTGAGPGVAEEAARRLTARHPGLQIVGVDSPRIAMPPGAGDESQAAAERVRASRADLVLVGFGSPKQELWIHKYRAALSPAVGVAVGAGIDFAAGQARRAPGWISRAGLEWAFRLVQEPRRLWRRYLVNDPRFLLILGSAALERALPSRRVT
jgi:N-acetylglucosaminyldiphosphoundecaprenol N-acetyl-beta-D-mannosaminyltransferase